MRQLLYASNTSLDVAEETLQDILSSSRRNNVKGGITGVLLHLEGGFMQVLEGDAGEVSKTFERICKDKRHWKTSVLLDREAPRAFAEWSMGFNRVKKDMDEAGVFSLTADAIAGRLTGDAPLEILTLLQTFYRINAPRGGHT